jgi:Legionella pneumophila major outer membrane protein precursor
MNRQLFGFFLLLAAGMNASVQKTEQGPAYPPISARNGRSNLPGADLNLDFLYWTAREDGLEFAYDGVSANSSTNAEAGKIYHPKEVWDYGYKIGLAAYTAYDGWDMIGEYTWFKLSTQNNVQNKTNLKRTWQVTHLPAGSTSFASSNWSLNFNVFDLLVRRKFYLSPKFVVQPACGLKFSWQKQTYMVIYDVGNDSGTMKINQKSQGAGIDFACLMDWYFTKQVSLTGRVAASTLWFKSTPHRVDTIERNEALTKTLNTKETISYAAPVLETFLGLSFESTLYKKKIQAIFQAGYEFQIWFDANQFERTILDANGALGNLNLQGLTLRGQIEF